MAAPSMRAHHAAVLAALRAGVDIEVGDGRAPGAAPPYAVMYAGGRGRDDGPVSAPHDDVAPLTQITGVGTTRDEAQHAADLCQAVLLDTALTIPGRSVLHVELEVSRPVMRDDQVSPPLFYAVDLYRIATTPA